MDPSPPDEGWSHAGSRRSRVALLPSWDLFRVGGSRISLDASWLIVFGATAGIAAFFLLPWRWAGAFAKYWYSPPTGHWDVSHWAAGLIAGALFFGSILVHELAHFTRAARYGSTAPKVRLYVLGDIVESAYQPQSPRQEVAVAIAGPVVSAVLGGVFVGLAWVLPERSIPQGDGAIGRRVQFVCGRAQPVAGIPAGWRAAVARGRMEAHRQSLPGNPDSQPPRHGGQHRHRPLGLLCAGVFVRPRVRPWASLWALELAGRLVSVVSRESGASGCGPPESPQHCAGE